MALHYTTTISYRVFSYVTLYDELLKLDHMAEKVDVVRFNPYVLTFDISNIRWASFNTRKDREVVIAIPAVLNPQIETATDLVVCGDRELCSFVHDKAYTLDSEIAKHMITAEEDVKRLKLPNELYSPIPSHAVVVMPRIDIADTIKRLGE